MIPDISDVQQLMWRIEDSVVQLKRLIADVVVTWNGKIQDLVLINKRRDEKHRKSDGGKPSAPPTSNSVECDVVSLEDIYLFIYLFINVCNLHCIIYSRPAHDTATNTEWQLPEAVLIQFVSPDDEHDMLETCREL